MEDCFNENTKEHVDSNTRTETNSSPPSNSNSCLKFFQYHGVPEAQGFSTFGIARGALIMSNVVYSTALIVLASKDAGCSEDDDDACDLKVYGFKPSSLISNIAILSGLLSAFFMPVIGAVVDFTPHRRLTGLLASVLIIVIQTTQIFLFDSTWFIMAVLQAIAALAYQVFILTIYAYLPEISRKVGNEKMTIYSSRFIIVQYAVQLLFLVLVGAVQSVIGLDDVNTARASQGMNVVWIAIFFYWGWRLMPANPAMHKLPEGHSILTEGFRQNWRTAKNINTHFKGGVRWFLLGTVFSEASVSAITTLSVIYLSDSLELGGNKIIIFFVVTLICAPIGSKISVFATNRTNPNVSWQMSMLFIFTTLIIGVVTLESIMSDITNYIWGMFIGIGLGWYYSTENQFFSSCVPKGIEAELSGFFVYCSQILIWLPPLVFTLLMENDIAQRWGIAVSSSLFLVAIGLLRCAAPWETIMEESLCESHSLQKNDDDDINDGNKVDEVQESSNPTVTT